ncbi:hypothetical protein GPECTOR_18g91 [Gonium pectorale]|uniref:Uncharacterized protein n=1 Tax=Gonium pectorale TaxID=33097 RepID=A0A150GK15_GONPE|nr:hypothetical protein GPECTOR_18g91 [Gonium pectorale]|eukprot:KXZ50117.1 hypothetical protein GPECTOR_18g91 [Gonium pectorale]
MRISVERRQLRFRAQRPGTEAAAGLRLSRDLGSGSGKAAVADGDGSADDDDRAAALGQPDAAANLTAGEAAASAGIDAPPTPPGDGAGAAAPAASSPPGSTPDAAGRLHGSALDAVRGVTAAPAAASAAAARLDAAHPGAGAGRNEHPAGPGQVPGGRTSSNAGRSRTGGSGLPVGSGQVDVAAALGVDLEGLGDVMTGSDVDEGGAQEEAEAEERADPRGGALAGLRPRAADGPAAADSAAAATATASVSAGAQRGGMKATASARMGAGNGGDGRGGPDPLVERLAQVLSYVERELLGRPEEAAVAAATAAVEPGAPLPPPPLPDPARQPLELFAEPPVTARLLARAAAAEAPRREVASPPSDEDWRLLGGVAPAPAAQGLRVAAAQGIRVAAAPPPPGQLAGGPDADVADAVFLKRVEEQRSYELYLRDIVLQPPVAAAASDWLQLQTLLEAARQERCGSDPQLVAAVFKQAAGLAYSGRAGATDGDGAVPAVLPPEESMASSSSGPHGRFRSAAEAAAYRAFGQQLAAAGVAALIPAPGLPGRSGRGGRGGRGASISSSRRGSGREVAQIAYGMGMLQLGSRELYDAVLHAAGEQLAALAAGRRGSAAVTAAAAAALKGGSPLSSGSLVAQMLRTASASAMGGEAAGPGPGPGSDALAAASAARAGLVVGRRRERQRTAHGATGMAAAGATSAWVPEPWTASDFANLAWGVATAHAGSGGSGAGGGGTSAEAVRPLPRPDPSWLAALCDANWEALGEAAPAQLWGLMWSLARLAHVPPEVRQQ